jgi:hypothetical protein
MKIIDLDAERHMRSPEYLEGAAVRDVVAGTINLLRDLLDADVPKETYCLALLDGLRGLNSPPAKLEAKA